jgi:hypothetical protein
MAMDGKQQEARMQCSALHCKQQFLAEDDEATPK